MPYINPQERTRWKCNGLGELTSEIVNGPGLTKGDLDYLITCLCLAYLRRRGVSFTHTDDLSGILSDVNQEIYRRLTAKYEDVKIAENGDVFLEEMGDLFLKAIGEKPCTD